MTYHIQYSFECIVNIRVKPHAYLPRASASVGSTTVLISVSEEFISNYCAAKVNSKETGTGTGTSFQKKSNLTPSGGSLYCDSDVHQTTPQHQRPSLHE
jgi:hypothetical protein